MDTITISLNNNWKFNLGDIPSSWNKSYQELDWKTVSIPHDWSVSLPFSKEYSSGTGYLAGGIGWYKNVFKLDKIFTNKRVSIVFDGIYKNSQVWCNGYYMGLWPNGYTTFRYDITDQVKYGEFINELTIKVSHPDISDSRWFTGSGITRKVYLLIEDDVHITGDGIIFQAENISAEKSDILVHNEIKNDTTTPKYVQVKNLLLDKKNNEVFNSISSVLIDSKQTVSITNAGILATPKLWSPNSPYLYNLKTYLQYSENNEFDNNWSLVNSTKIGIRSIHFDANKGFLLNNISTKLKGVCIHHDAGCLGGAVPTVVWLRRLKKLKDMGCNAIRMSHNPHMPELYDLCDLLGFLVIDEAFDEWEGCKNKWSTGHNVYPPKHQGYFEHYPEWHEKDLTALITRDRNHPSIIMWSIGNEIDYPNDPYCHPLFETMTGNNDKDKPEQEQMYNDRKPNAERLVALTSNLVSIVKKSDTTRPVSLAFAFPELSSQIGLFNSLDVIGYNYKEHLYSQDHERFPNSPILGSENNHDFKNWLVVKNTPYISAQFLWTGIDYLGEASGWPIHGSSAGLLTLAGFEKTDFYRRKSWWSDKPSIYLVTARYSSDNHEYTPMFTSYNYVTGELIEVRCYTNLGYAELFCNNTSMGIKQFDIELGYISWVIPYEHGELRATAIDDKNNMIECKLFTTYSSCQIHANIVDTSYQNTLPEYAPNIQNFYQIEVEILDQNSICTTTESPMILVTPDNNCHLIGIENGDLADVTPYTENYRRAYEGRLIVYVAKKDCNITANVIISSPNLNSFTVTI